MFGFDSSASADGPQEDRGPSAAARLADAVRSFQMPSSPWVMRGVMAAAALVVAYFAIPYAWQALPSFSKTAPPSATAAKPTDTKAPAAAPAAGGRKAGGIRVKTTPAGARVLVDGKARGVSPLTLTDIAPGNHEVVLESNAGTIQRTVTVAASQTAEIEESIFSGWVAVYAPFEVAISENGRVLRPDERNQFLLPPGVHQIRLSNKQLGYDSTQRVEVKPGETFALRLTPDPSKLTVTASDAAEVWLDGAKVGDTPVTAFPVPLGSHDLVVKRVSGGEKRFPITISVSPFTLHVDFQ